MAVRVSEGRRLGNAADAGALCRTARKPGGVEAGVYRRMVSQMGAPGPLGYNPVNGDREYDLDAVARWNAGRSKSPVGAWRRDISHRTPMRFETLRAAAAGRLSVVEDGKRRELHRDGQRWEGRVRLRMFGDLERGGLVEVADIENGVGRVQATEEGAVMLARWTREASGELHERGQDRARAAAARRVG